MCNIERDREVGGGTGGPDGPGRCEGKCLKVDYLPCTYFPTSLRRDFSGSGHTSDLKNSTPVATLPGVWRYKVNAGTGRPGVSTL